MNSTNTSSASSWVSAYADSPPDTPPPPPSNPNDIREEEKEKEEEEEEELVEDYDEDYGDYYDDDDSSSSSANDDNIGGPNLSLLGPSELSDNERGRVEKDDKKEKDDDDKKVKGGCSHSFLKLCKRTGSSILEFVRGVTIRIKSKISKKQILALVALTFAAIKTATITSSSSDPVGTPEEIAEAEALEERNDALMNDITNTVIESVVEEFVH